MKKMSKLLFVFGLAVVAITACKNEKPEVPGIVLENMDTSVKPQDDFFRHVNGRWIDSTKIPDDQTSWGGFNQLRKETDADVLAILNKAIEERDFPIVKDAKGDLIDSDQEKAVNYYESIMDTVSRNAQGTMQKS